jgi:squalene-hopene/tetraprenyl-beta-curcumene cyclase
MDINKNILSNTIEVLKNHLLEHRTPGGYWQGKLSGSALSTATAVFALAIVDKEKYESLIFKGLDWLKDNCNADGGWGDTVDSPSNISTTLLCWSAFSAAGDKNQYDEAITKAESWIINYTGSIEPKDLVKAIDRRYGNDRSFSAPILTMCALADRLGSTECSWRWIKPLPFELAVCPHQLFKWLRLPVVSYAMPALIAIGYANYYHRKPINPIARVIRFLTHTKALAVLRNIQPQSGGFLEAAPLTAFVVMSLAASGEKNNDVVMKGTDFLVASARDDGSWPIDTNLATWVTTLGINAFAACGDIKTVLSLNERRALQKWLLSLQYHREHPYTHARPGGWAWTNLSGAVPDADDTAGALIAMRNLDLVDYDVVRSAIAGVRWLLSIQNRDGGIPTFCRGWTALPFDKSAPDLTAHAIHAFNAWIDLMPPLLQKQMEKAIRNMLNYLKDVQKEDGLWIPLWFGNQHVPNQENPVYGTAKVLIGCVNFDRQSNVNFASMADQGIQWLLSAQNENGGWGGAKSVGSTIEETALAVDALVEFHKFEIRNSKVEILKAISCGVRWLIERTGQGTKLSASPIGLYFARLWYFEELYPAIFALSALHKAQRLDS